MNIFLGIVGVLIIALLIAVIVLLLKKDSGKKEGVDFKMLNERLIRMEGEVSKINPGIDRNFRENRKEINENLDRMRASNE